MHFPTCSKLSAAHKGFASVTGETSLSGILPDGNSCIHIGQHYVLCCYALLHQGCVVFF